MHLVIEVVTELAAIASLPAVVGSEPLDAARVLLTAPDAHIVVRANTGDATSLARASIWWSDGPRLDGQLVGRIGHYAAASDPAALRLLGEARSMLAQRGLRTVVGPMDGTTWFSYRFVTDARGELPEAHPPVLFEPAQPAAWPAQWRAAGFTPLAGYVSLLADELSSRDPRLDAVRERARGELTIRSVDMADMDAELDRIYAVASEAFRSAFLYTPIGRADYHALYAGARDLIIPELVLLAERHGEPVGFSFTLPDHLERLRGEPLRTVVVKTVAVLPGRRTAGLGSWLVEESHERAQRLGFTRAVHALMHESNASLSISRRQGQGQVMRRYTLFSASTDGDGSG